jgi:hypothetical protein
MSAAGEGEPYYCAHCEFELPADLYILHMPYCIAWHIAAWPIHEVNYGGGKNKGSVFGSACPELCGKPHMTVEERDKLLLKILSRERKLALDGGQAEA